MHSTHYLPELSRDDFWPRHRTQPSDHSPAVSTHAHVTADGTESSGLEALRRKTQDEVSGAPAAGQTPPARAVLRLARGPEAAPAAAATRPALAALPAPIQALSGGLLRVKALLAVRFSPWGRTATPWGVSAGHATLRESQQLQFSPHHVFFQFYCNLLKRLLHYQVGLTLQESPGPRHRRQCEHRAQRDRSEATPGSRGGLPGGRDAAADGGSTPAAL